jgi:hypothetical protein
VPSPEARIPVASSADWTVREAPEVESAAGDAAATEDSDMLVDAVAETEASASESVSDCGAGDEEATSLVVAAP